MLKLLLKIWPALTPIIVYIIWVYVIKKFIIKKLLKKDQIIEAEKEVGSKSTADKFKTKEAGYFSLNNQTFIIVLYSSLIWAIISFIFTAISA